MWVRVRVRVRVGVGVKVRVRVRVEVRAWVGVRVRLRVGIAPKPPRRHAQVDVVDASGISEEWIEKEKKVSRPRPPARAPADALHSRTAQRSHGTATAHAA